MKRFLSVLIVILSVFTVAFSGCGGANIDNAGDDYEVNLHLDENITAELVIGVENYTREQKIVSEIGELLTAKYKNVTIRIEPFSANISQQLTSWAKTGSVPDIFVNNSFDMFTLADSEVLLNLDPYINAEAKDPESTFKVSDFYEAFWKLGQEKFDGRQFMIPRSADRVVVHYNVAKFKAAGVDMSLVKNGWTWDDFFKVCETLRTYYDSIGDTNKFLVESWMTWEAVYNPILEAFGVKYFGENNKADLNNSETQEAMNFLKSFIDEKYVAPLSISASSFAGDVASMVFHSQAASVAATALGQHYPNAEKVSDYYNVVTMPVFEGNEKIGCGAAGYSLYAGSKNRDLAWQWIKLLLSKEGQNVMADSGSNYPPIRKDMADFTDPTNHWGKGYEDLNLSAYTYNSGIGDDPDWNCYTTFITKQKPKQAKNIDTAIQNFIRACVGGTKFETAAKNAENTINRYIMM